MLNPVRNAKGPGEIIFNEEGLPVPASRVEKFLRDRSRRAILILKSGESVAGALDGISYSGVKSLRDGSEEGTWRIELFHLRGSSFDSSHLEYSQFEKRQAEALYVFNDHFGEENVPDDVLLIFEENASKMTIARDLVQVIRQRLELAKSVLSLVEDQMHLREPLTAEES